MNTQIKKIENQIQSVSDPFEMMDKLDDEIILAEIEGRIVDTWVYHFRDDNGREQWGLSKVGVDASCSELAKKGEVIRELELSFHPDPVNREYVVFISKAGRYAVARDGKEVLLDTAIGTKRQWIKLKLKTGAIIFNAFYFEQGAMKALRNARSRLISEEIKTKVIAFAKEKNKTKVLVGYKPTPAEEASKEVVEKTVKKCPECGTTGRYHSKTCNLKEA